MSVRIMSLVFENSKLSSTEKLIMLALADHANDEGKSVYPSQQTLSRKTSLARGTVNRYISELVGKGYLRRVRYLEERSNVLELEIRLKRLLVEGVTESYTSDEGGVTDDDRGCHPGLQGGVTDDDTNHHLNHHLNVIKKGFTGDLFDDCLFVYQALKENTMPTHKYVDMINRFKEKGVTAEDYYKAIVEQDASGRYSGAKSPTSYKTYAEGIAEARNNPNLFTYARPPRQAQPVDNITLLERMHANGEL